MLDFPLMLRVKMSAVERIHPQSNKFTAGVENKATGDSKRNDSPVDTSAVCLCQATVLRLPLGSK